MKDFTAAERNQKLNGSNQKYYSRLLIWKTQARLIDGGMSLIAANNRISTITGETSVTKIINKLIQFKRVDKDRGGVHLQLHNG